MLQHVNLSKFLIQLDNQVIEGIMDIGTKKIFMTSIALNTSLKYIYYSEQN